MVRYTKECRKNFNNIIKESGYCEEDRKNRSNDIRNITWNT